MKKLIALCLVFALLFAVRPVNTVCATGNARLSTLSDEAILAFLEEYNVEIPDGFATSDADLVDKVMPWIVAVENKPDAVFNYNFPDLKNVSSAVKNAVNDYYGHTLINGYIPTIGTYGVTDRLQQNYIWVIPSNADQYNGYAYVLGLTDGDYYPGWFSGNRYSTDTMQTLSVSQLANYVMYDLAEPVFAESGNACVNITTTRPSYNDLLPGQTAICIRMGEDDYGHRDYHLMKLFYDEEESTYGDMWLHKPGDSAILQFKYLPSNNVDWICEGYFSQSYQIHDGNLKFTSTIYYIIFREDHAITTTEYDYHDGNVHHYVTREYCAGCDTEWIDDTQVPCSNCG